MKKDRISILCVILLMAFSNCNQSKRWTLQTEDTKLVIGVDASQKLNIFELTNPATGWNWTKTPSVFRLTDKVYMDSISYTTDWNYQSGEIDESDGTKLTITFANANPAMELKSVWQARKGQGPVRHTMFIKNTSGKTIRIYEQESIILQVSDPEKNTKVWYINDDASSPDSVGVYKELLTESYRKTLRISDAAKDWIPFVVLDANTSNGLYIGWEWSIGWIDIAKGNGVAWTMIKAGNGDDFRTDLYAGETFEVPPGFIGTYKGDVDDCGNSLRKYLFNYSMPAILKNDTGYPKVEWNAFAPTGKKQGSWDCVESKYYPLIDDIAPLGFEDYLIKGFKADFFRSDGGGGEAGDLVSGIAGSNHRSHYREDIGYWATKGFYEVIDSMYKKFPGFIWENCWSGGRLKDYGTLMRAGRIQNQDQYWPIDARRSFYDASYALHPIQIAALTGSFAPWQASGSVYEYRCSSMGASYWHPDAPNGGNGGPVWTAKQREDIKNAVSTYKNKLRPLIRNGNLYHIFPRPDDVVWDGIEYFDPSLQKGVVYIFKPKSTVDNQSIKLKGLDANLEYKLTFEDGTNENKILKGSELMNTGVSVVLKGELISELMFIEKK